MKTNYMNYFRKYIKRVFRHVLNLKKTRLVDTLFDVKELNYFVSHNRKSLSKIDRWIDADVYANSLFHYGLPEDVKLLIDSKIGETITYSDLMIYLSKRLSKVVYLELGVSVGKNFWQLMNFFRNSELVGLDIEEINPVLEKFLDKTNKVTWKTPNGSIKKDRSSLTKYTYKTNGNNIIYISADILTKGTGSHIPKKKFTMLFSDAFHSSKALKKEWKMVNKYNLINKDEFILVWDDLVGDDMKNAFEEIWQDIKSKYKLDNSHKIRVLTNGWIGQTAHEIGIIYKFKL